MATEPTISCKLCGGRTIYQFSLPLVAGLQGDYLECAECRMLQSHHLDTLGVQGLIDIANYSPDVDLDTGAAWRQFCIASRLSQLVTARVLPRKEANFNVLDLGRGTGFLVSLLAHHFGWSASGFDPYWNPAYAQPNIYQDWQSVKQHGPYNLIIATEVFEHFIEPKEELIRIRELIAEDHAFIYVTTGRYVPAQTKSSWDYLAPASGHHVTFYARETMLEIARLMKANGVFQMGAEYEWLFVFDKTNYGWTKKLKIGSTSAFLRLATRCGLLSKIE